MSTNYRELIKEGAARLINYSLQQLQDKKASAPQKATAALSWIEGVAATSQLVRKSDAKEYVNREIATFVRVANLDYQLKDQAIESLNDRIAAFRWHPLINEELARIGQDEEVDEADQVSLHNVAALANPIVNPIVDAFEHVSSLQFDSNKTADGLRRSPKLIHIAQSSLMENIPIFRPKGMEIQVAKMNAGWNRIWQQGKTATKFITNPSAAGAHLQTLRSLSEASSLGDRKFDSGYQQTTSGQIERLTRDPEMDPIRPIIDVPPRSRVFGPGPRSANPNIKPRPFNDKPGLINNPGSDQTTNNENIQTFVEMSSSLAKLVEADAVMLERLEEIKKILEEISLSLGQGGGGIDILDRRGKGGGKGSFWRNAGFAAASAAAVGIPLVMSEYSPITNMMHQQFQTQKSDVTTNVAGETIERGATWAAGQALGAGQRALMKGGAQAAAKGVARFIPGANIVVGGTETAISALGTADNLSKGNLAAGAYGSAETVANAISMIPVPLISGIAALAAGALRGLRQSEEGKMIDGESQKKFWMALRDSPQGQAMIARQRSSENIEPAKAKTARQIEALRETDRRVDRASPVQQPPAVAQPVVVSSPTQQSRTITGPLIGSFAPKTVPSVLTPLFAQG